MKSHTVPRKLLEQFSYFDPRSNSLRLWRYEKNLPPYPKASPRTATRIDGHLHHPDIAAKEAELESRLAREFETPVNLILPQISSSFIPTDEQRRHLTRYVTLLFHRSQARRGLTRHSRQVTVHAVNRFLANETQVLTVAANASITLLLSGRTPQWLVTPRVVRAAARNLLLDFETERNVQANYAESLERAMSFFDDVLYSGEWHLLNTAAHNPFIISDAPVVTWERLDAPGTFSYGIGFQRPNVEVLLPISPSLCFHILPKVQRTRSIQQPTTTEVNIGQAAFATQFCFADISSNEIDRVVKQNIGIAELGVRSFTVWHRDYGEAIYAILMSNTHWLLPPRR